MNRRVLFFLLALEIGRSASAAAEFKVGVGSVDVTPEYAIRLSGYAARKTESEGIAQRLHTKAIAVEQADGEMALFMTIDNVGITKEIHDQIAAEVGARHGIRSDHLVIFSSHTHSAPCLSNAIANLFVAPLPPEQEQTINRYTKELVGKMEQAAADAIKDLAPAKIFWGKGKVDFAKNRRTEGGPVDHDLPVLVFKRTDGRLKAVLANYACHCTTLGGDWNKVHADWAGFAQGYIEKNNPEATALISIGCGGDANPFPRGKEQDADEHGDALAKEIQEILSKPMTELTEKIEFRQKLFELPFQTLPTREEWEKKAKEEGIVGYHAKRNLERLNRGESLPTTLPYQVSTWNFGKQLAMVFLPGEVVVDYSLRLKREFDPERLWVSGYANWVPCYIPSERVLREGGYEPESSLWYYDRPARLSPTIENLIISSVHELMPDKFHAERNYREFPAAKTPRESLAALRVTPGLRVELVASEPLVESPVAMDWGADGKLWVVEMRDFPQGMDGNWKPGGRVKVLEDLDGDGVYDKATLFLDAVPFPTGITCWNGGALICAAPDILFARDTNGDGKADEVKKLFSGFATENFQARVNSLAVGLDGWFYGANGLIGGMITGGALKTAVNISNRDFRFRPESGDFETASGLTQQGRVRDDFGNWFGCDNSTLIWQYPLPEEFLKRNPNFAPPATRVSISAGKDPNQLYPKSYTLERFNEPGQANRTTSACGLGLYRDDLLGEEFYGNAFVCEPVHNLVRRMKLDPAGVAFQAIRAPEYVQSEFLASYDNWFRPVQTRTGPDGALWVVDMYRFVVEHPRWITPERLKTLDVRAGADKGRIYRIYPKERNVGPIRDLTKIMTVELAKQINSRNGTDRDRIQLELVKRNDNAAVKVLTEMIESDARPAVRIQALSTVETLEPRKASALIKPLLADLSSEMRAFGASVAARQKGAGFENELIPLAGDSSAQVVLQAAFALGNYYDRSSTKALADILVKHGNDPWIRSAVFSSSAGRGMEILQAIEEKGDAELLGTAARPLVASSGSSGDPAAQLNILKSLISAKKDWDAWRFEAIRQILEKISGDAKRESKFLSNSEARQSVEQVYTHAKRTAEDQEVPAETRASAVLLLGVPLDGSYNARETLLRLLGTAQPVPVQAAVSEAVVSANALKEVFGKWEQFTPSVHHDIISAAMKKADVIPDLLQHLESARSLGEISIAQKQQLKRHRNPEVRALAGRLFPDSKSSRAEVLQRYEPALTLKGNSANGARLFGLNCATCHFFRGQGYSVGPNLAALTDKSPAFLLIAMLDPNAAVENRFLAYSIETIDGRDISGVISDESTSSVTVSLAGGQKEVVLRRDVKSIRPSNVSLMPEGLEQTLTPEDVADIITYLQLSPAGFGSASAEAARKSLGSFGASIVPYRIRFSSEQSPYPSWLGRLPMHHCRQTDGKGSVSWEVNPREKTESFRFPIALGFISQPSGFFEFGINGKTVVKFNVEVGDASWESNDRTVRLSYVVMERNEEDSNGILTVEIAPKVLPVGEPIIFSVKGSAAESQRWFGIYELPHEVASLQR